MANQSLSLGQHWNDFIDRKVSQGRYRSASEVVRDALRLLEERENEKLENLRNLLIEGENSGFTRGLNPEEIIRSAKKEYQENNK